MPDESEDLRPGRKTPIGEFRCRPNPELLSIGVGDPSRLISSLLRDASKLVIPGFFFVDRVSRGRRRSILFDLDQFPFNPGVLLAGLLRSPSTLWAFREALKNVFAFGTGDRFRFLLFARDRILDFPPRIEVPRDRLVDKSMLVNHAGVIDQETVVLPLPRPESPAGHLEIEPEGFGRPRDHAAGDRRAVPSLAEHHTIADDINCAVPKVRENLGPLVERSIPIQVGGADAGLLEFLGDMNGVFHAGREDDGLPALRQAPPILDDRPDERLFVHPLRELILRVISHPNFDAGEVRRRGSIVFYWDQEARLGELRDRRATDHVIVYFSEPSAVSTAGRRRQAQDGRLGIRIDQMSIGLREGPMAFVEDDQVGRREMHPILFDRSSPESLDRGDLDLMDHVGLAPGHNDSVGDAEPFQLVGALIDQLPAVGQEQDVLFLGDGVLYDLGSDDCLTGSGSGLQEEAPVASPEGGPEILDGLGLIFPQLDRFSGQVGE